jgi:HECT-domain (ubiquitin-transferase)
MQLSTILMQTFYVQALAARVRASFRAEGWEEKSLQVAKAVVHRDLLISDAISIMDQYATDATLNKRRLEVRFDGESGFDAASGDEAGVTRGFYADVAEALLSCDVVAGVSFSSTCLAGLEPASYGLSPTFYRFDGRSHKLPLWIPEIDASGQVVIPTPRAAPASVLGIYPRPLSNSHPQWNDVMKYFRFMGRLFAAAMRDGFMFPLPLSTAFLKLVQCANSLRSSRWKSANLLDRNTRIGSIEGCAVDRCFSILDSEDLPRPGFLGGEVYAVEIHVCHELDRIDLSDPPLSKMEKEGQYRRIASDKSFAQRALGKKYECSFDDYFQDRTFVDPLDPTQGIEAHALCPNGHNRNVTIHNIREWVALSKAFMLHDGVIGHATAFRAGVDDFFPSDFLRLFTPDELQRDVCGVGDNVDCWDEESIIKLLKLDGKGTTEASVAVAAIGGNAEALSRRFGPTSGHIKHLIKALLEASSKQRRQFLSFVTSVPIVTPGLIEVVPVVSPSGEFLPMRDPGCLPRANTCARRLYLPKFDTYESFSQVLWAVIREESKHKGFFEWSL